MNCAMRDLTNKSTKSGRFLIVLLTVSLLFVQVKQLHVHLYDHYHHIVESGSDQSTTHSNHQSIVHVNDTVPNFEHQNGKVEVELSQKVLINNLPIESLIALFFPVILLVPLLFIFNRKFSHIVWYILLQKRYSISPPLRAPPFF